MERSFLVASHETKKAKYTTRKKKHIEIDTGTESAKTNTIDIFPPPRAENTKNQHL